MISKTKMWVRTITVLSLALTFVFVAASRPASVYANRADELREKIEALEDQINQNQGRVDQLEAEAATLAEAVRNFDAQIAETNKQIELINLKLEALRVELEATRAELARQKDILRSSLREHYTFGNVRTIELLVESNGFSEYFDQQEYLDRIRSGIQTSAKRIAELEAQLVVQQEEQQRLLAEQQTQKQALESQRAAKNKILQETRGEERLYKSRVNELERQKRSVEVALERYIQSLLDSGVSLGPVNKGDFVGRVGNTGYSTGPHLHFAIQHNGSFQDPRIVMSNNGWAFPVPDYRYISQGFHGGHPAIDIAASEGKSVVSTADGEIIHRGCLSAGTIYSNFAVLVRHPGGYVSRYIHLQAPPGSAYDACRANTYYR